MKKVLIIAEAGVNHNGSIELAKKMIDAASAAGADIIKFQTFRSEKIASRHAAKASYQKKNSGKSESQLSMLKKLELSANDHRTLISYCKKKKIQFLSTAFDPESLDLLYSLGIRVFKIPSGEITNLPFLRKIGALRGKIILSTGMADQKEIETALKILVSSGTAKKNITVLHCHTEYPTPMKDVNLLAMNAIGARLGVEVGYSDHTLGIEVPVAAVALGARVIEKHFTLDKNMSGPDHLASLNPEELSNMVKAIRNIESALGSAIKKPSLTEVKNKISIRKSIHLATDLSLGHVIRELDLIMKRPGNGISPMKMDDVIGKKTLRNLRADDMLNPKDFR